MHSANYPHCGLRYALFLVQVLSFLESTNASTKKANDSLASYVSETQR